MEEQDPIVASNISDDHLGMVMKLEQTNKRQNECPELAGHEDECIDSTTNKSPIELAMEQVKQSQEQQKEVLERLMKSGIISKNSMDPSIMDQAVTTSNNQEQQKELMMKRDPSAKSVSFKFSDDEHSDSSSLQQEEIPTETRLQRDPSGEVVKIRLQQQLNPEVVEVISEQPTNLSDTSKPESIEESSMVDPKKKNPRKYKPKKTKKVKKVKKKKKKAANKVLEQQAKKTSQSSSEDQPNSGTLQIPTDVASKRPPRPTKLRIQHGEKVWLAKGYKAVEPVPETTYFPHLMAQHNNDDVKEDVVGGDEGKRRVVSICIPCFNEEGSALKRTIQSLQKSYLPPGFVLEILVVMDGTKQIDSTMAKYLHTLFGFSISENDVRKNPFCTFPSAQTIIVENVSNGDIRDSLTLLIKRNNKRKVNSQKWWLYGHAKDVGAEFAFATDCGIVFDSKCLLLMLERMIRQPNCSGLTGYQRVMPSLMQGDGSFELCADPLGYFLRQLQSYDFEMSQSTTKSLVDSLGFIPVLPGPCSLFRYKRFVSIADDYFKLTTIPLRGDSSDIVLGNVQLAEDRFPPVLLTFPENDDNDDDSDLDESLKMKGNPIPGQQDSSKDSNNNKKKKLPVTGFEHDAIFYFEAEKPLGQLVKQRRRWINGSYMAGYWVLKGGWIGLSNKGILAKIGAASVLLFELIQGALIRLITPATLSCGLVFMVQITPSIWNQNVEELQQAIDGELDDPLLFFYGCIAASLYLIVFAIFMLSHTPNAVPSTDESSSTKKKKKKDSTPAAAAVPVSYHIDTTSAYRPWLFGISFLMNMAMSILFVYVGYGIYSLIGWSDAPLYFRMLSIIVVFPYVVALLDGIINSTRPNVKAFVNLIVLTPIFWINAIWFYVWFPCYASARISDLSWGNRDAHHDTSSSMIARHRAYLGRVVSVTIVVSNVLIASAIMAVMHVFGQLLTIVLFSLLGFNVLLHVINVLDMLWRLLTVRIPHWLYGAPPPPLKLRAANYGGVPGEGQDGDLDNHGGGGTVDLHVEESMEFSQDFTMFFDKDEEEPQTS